MLRFLVVMLGVFIGSMLGARAEGRSKEGGKRSGFLANPITTGLIGGCIAAFGFALYEGAAAGSSGPITWPDAVAQVESMEDLEDLRSASHETPVLLYFYADWCLPCRIDAPKLGTFPSQGVPLAVVNVDRAPAVAAAYQIEMIPVYVYLYRGAEAIRSHESPAAGNARAYLESLAENGTD